jgi:hypothetical protein
MIAISCSGAGLRVLNGTWLDMSYRDFEQRAACPARIPAMAPGIPQRSSVSCVCMARVPTLSTSLISSFCSHDSSFFGSLPGKIWHKYLRTANSNTTLQGADLLRNGPKPANVDRNLGVCEQWMSRMSSSGWTEIPACRTASVRPDQRKDLGKEGEANGATTPAGAGVSPSSGSVTGKVIWISMQRQQRDGLLARLAERPDV